MIAYVTIGASDFDRSVAFYDALLTPLGATRLMDFRGFVLFGKSMEEPSVAVVSPHDGNPQSVGNGMMVALRMESKESVDAIHARALALGGTDEGAPGPRGDSFYAGYFRDVDGNKLNAVFFG